jgi:hypothetical protein
MKITISMVLVALVLILLTSCADDTVSVNDYEEVTIPDAISSHDLHTTLRSGLSIDAYELVGPPSTEPVIFVPVSDLSQEQILALHAEARNQQFPDNSFYDEMTLNRIIQLDHRELIARQVISTSTEVRPDLPESISIEVLFDDEVIYTVDAGDSSPITPLRGLWNSDEDWVLEYSIVTETYNEAENTAHVEILGHLVKNGVLLNEQYSYDEIFSFQFLKGKPFYFFEKGGQIGISYDEQVTMLGFEEILHYGCCSAGLLNPRRAQSMVSFFAQKDNIWYYVEIGNYSSEIE